MKGFIWKGSTNKGLHLVNWKEVTEPINRGDLGVREARLRNVTFLGKLIWEVMHDSNKLWVRVLHDKYISEQGIFGEHKRCGSST